MSMLCYAGRQCMCLLQPAQVPEEDNVEDIIPLPDLTASQELINRRIQ